MFGFYDDTAKKIFFMRIINSSDLTTLQMYSGYRFTGPASTPLTFAGSFEVFSGAGGTAQRHILGWTASKKP
jgi:hypothetical protein